MVGLRLEQRIDHLLAPLDGAVGRGHRAVGLELGRGRQQVDAVLAVMHHRGHGRIRIDNDQQIEFLHRLLHFRPYGSASSARGPRRTMARTLSGWSMFSLSSSTPSIQRDTGMPLVLHQFLIGEAAEHIVVIDIPDTGPVLPRAGLQAVVARQCVGKDAEIGRALHIVVAAEDVRSATGLAHVAERQLQNAVGPGVVVAVGVLGAAHAPDNGAGTVIYQRPCDPAQLRARNPGNALGLFWGPFLRPRP